MKMLPVFLSQAGIYCWLDMLMSLSSRSNRLSVGSCRAYQREIL